MKQGKSSTKIKMDLLQFYCCCFLLLYHFCNKTPEIIFVFSCIKVELALDISEVSVKILMVGEVELKVC